MTCRRCVARGQTWPGSPPKCAFESGVFNSDNWNCATMNDLRDAFDSAAIWNEDQYAALVPLSEPIECGDYLVLTWYKRRGRTEGAWVLEDESMRPLSLEDAESILGAVEARENARMLRLASRSGNGEGLTMTRDWKVDARRLLSEDCEDVHGSVPPTRKAVCPRHLAVALHQAYEAGQADERSERGDREG